MCSDLALHLPADCRGSFAWSFSVKKKVLKHHPDKKKGRVDAADKLVSNEDYFTCITIANDILSNPSRRRAYDSVDPLFNDSIPSVSNPARNNFYEVFGPVFQRNARSDCLEPQFLLFRCFYVAVNKSQMCPCPIHYGFSVFQKQVVNCKKSTTARGWEFKFWRSW